MAEIKLLDCTLRDGGYINDWKYGYLTTKSIIRKLVDSQVDYVELGFLRNEEYRSDRTVFNNCEEMKALIPEKHGKTAFFAMALHNCYDIEKLEPYDGKTVEGIRVTFHDYDIDEGLEFVKKVKEKGYKVFCNPINIMGYSDMQILEIIQKVNQIKPHGFSIVDTFGSMMKEDLLRIYSLVEHNLDQSIVVGLHLHENLALSYSLAQEFIGIRSRERECIIDASMQGMGRAPGNLCIELIMDYLNKKADAHYNINPVLDAIDDYILQFRQLESWGYNTAYSLSAKYNLHRNYAEYLINKPGLRAKHINQILASIDFKKKTVYDKDYIEQLYKGFQQNDIDDRENLKKMKEAIGSKTVLIMAPGSSVKINQELIRTYMKEKKPYVISANFGPKEFKIDCMFFSNAMRLEHFLEQEEFSNIWITSNLLSEKKTGMNIVNYTELSIDEKGICDNCVIMLLKLLLRIGTTRVVMAGFDGYNNYGNNYVEDYMSSFHTKGAEENLRIMRYIQEIEKEMDLEFITPSKYVQLE